MVEPPQIRGVRTKVLRQSLYLLMEMRKRKGGEGEKLIQHVAFCDTREIQEILGVTERTAYDYQAFVYHLHMLLEYGEEPI